MGADRRSEFSIAEQASIQSICSSFDFNCRVRLYLGSTNAALVFSFRLKPVDKGGSGKKLVAEIPNIMKTTSL